MALWRLFFQVFRQIKLKKAFFVIWAYMVRGLKNPEVLDYIKALKEQDKTRNKPLK